MDEMKICSKCGIGKPVDAFNKDRSKPDGLYSSCRACKLAAMVEYQKSDQCRASVRAAMARFRKTEKHTQYIAIYKTTDACKESSRKSSKKYRSTPHGKQKAIEQMRKWRDANWEQFLAVAYVGKCVAKGRIPRASSLKCEHCESQAREYHHFNGYAKEHRLDVIPLCKKCHVKAHSQAIG